MGEKGGIVAKQPSKGRKASKDTGGKSANNPLGDESVAPADPLIDAIPPEYLGPTLPERGAPEFDRAAPPPPPAEEISTTPPPQEPSPAPARSEPPQTASRGGFLPLLLGGLVAGVIGFAVATFTAPAANDDMTVELAQQSTAIATLQERLAEMPQPDTSALEADLNAQIAEVSATVSDLAARIDALESRPGVVLSDDSDAGAAVAADVEALRAQLAEMADAAQTDLDEARAAAAQIEENAAAAARNAAARAALSRVQTSLESGAPIGAALGDLEDVTGETAPDALLAVADGVPTLAALQDTFPDVARDALAAARREGVAGEETSGIGAFLRTQLDVRSTAPREGDSTDAILSRAEAALRDGRLSDTLAELGALPELVRAEMSDWLARAEARADAIAAVDALSTSYSDN